MQQDVAGILEGGGDATLGHLATRKGEPAEENAGGS